MSTPVRLADLQLSTSAASIYTCPAGARVRLTTIVAANATAVAATVTVEVVPSGQAASTAFGIAVAVAVGANAEINVLPSPGGAQEEIVLLPGDQIFALAGTAAAVNLNVDGEELDFGAQS